MVLQNLKRNLVIVLVSLIICVPLAFLLSVIGRAMRYSDARVILTAQYGTYIRTKQFAEDTGQIPETIDDFPESKLNFVHYYNPDAWQKPESVLFLYRLEPYYCVTFGNNNQAILLYWKKRPSEGEIPNKFDITKLSSNPATAGFSYVVISVVIAVLVTFFLSDTFLIRSEKIVEPKAD